MTISSPVSRVDCPGNGSATTFSFSPITITQASDLMVWLLDNVGNQTLLTQGTGPTQYVINTPFTYPGTGSITYPGSGGTTLATGWKLTVKQRVPLLQTFQPQNQGPFLAATYGAAFDYLLLAIQELREEITRTILAAETDTGTLTLPSAGSRANQMLGFDGSGNLIAAQPSSALVSTLMQPIVDASTVAAALNLLTANAITQALTGQFYQANGAIVNRVADRLFVGQAVLQSGNLVLPVLQGTAGGWLDYYQALIGLEPTAGAQLASITDSPGQSGVMGAARSLNFTVSGQSAIGLNGYTYNNHATLGTGAWAIYTESYRWTTATSNTFGLEVATVQQTGVTVLQTPYTGNPGATVGIQLDSGSGWDAALQPGLVSGTAAVTIVQNTSDNSAPWLKGIIAIKNSIVDNGAGLHEVIAMPIAYGFQWYNTSGGQTSSISSSATSATNAASIIFGTNGMEVAGAASGAPVAAFVPIASAVNYINIQSAATGNPPSVSAVGSDTNINLVLSPQGTASVMTTGSCMPFTNNTYGCGAAGNKWTAVYATNGTIQTSDPTMKTEMAPLPAALPIIAAINPITFKWKLGGPKPVAKEAEIDDPMYEDYEVPQEEAVLQPNGQYHAITTMVTKRRPVIDEVPVLNPDGTPVMDLVALTRGTEHGGREVIHTPTPRMHPVHRTQKKTITQHALVDGPGSRTHWGFSAAEVKAATPAGMDWAAYVKGDDGTEHIRPDQLIPVLWKAMQELAAQVEALTKEVAAMKAAFK